MIVRPSLSVTAQQNTLSADSCLFNQPKQLQTTTQLQWQVYIEAACNKNTEAALKAYARAIELAPKDPSGYYNRGQTYGGLKNYPTQKQ